MGVYAPTQEQFASQVEQTSDYKCDQMLLFQLVRKELKMAVMTAELTGVPGSPGIPAMPTRPESPFSPFCKHTQHTTLASAISISNATTPLEKQCRLRSSEVDSPLECIHQ